MTNDDLRIAVAEADGWKPNGAGYWHKDRQVCALEFQDCEGRGRDIYPLPNYPFDLNAIAQAYDDKIRGNIVLELKFYQSLNNQFDRNPDGSYRHSASIVYDIANANARQRCIAFLDALK